MKNQSEVIKEMAKILGNSCLWQESGKLDCIHCKYYQDIDRICCSFGMKEAEILYNAGYRKHEPCNLENCEEFQALQFENEKLKDRLAECENGYEGTIHLLRSQMESIRADTIAEFAEKMKYELGQEVSPTIDLMPINKVIDEIAEKMEGKE